MTLAEFKKLDEKTKAGVIYNTVQLAQRWDKEHHILLYQIDSFYVEIFYHKKDDSIQRVRSFRSLEQLDPYLGQIDVTKLIKP